MLLVLTVVSAGVPYGTHAGGHPVAEIASGPVADGSRDCSDHHAPSAQCAPLPPAFSPGPAAMPEPSAGRLVSIAVHDDTPAPAGTAEAMAPSLHALGISRT